jgi:hypothetical protein
MRFAALFIACGLLVFSTACKERTTPAYDSTPPATAPAGEGPAERTGRALDEAGRRAAESVGRGLEEAGREIQEHVPERN